MPESLSHINSPLKQLAPRPKWAESGDDASAVIMTTRVRIARNLAGEVFPNRMDTEGRIRILRSVSQVIAHLPEADEGIFLSLAALTPVEIGLLVERRAISPQLARDDKPRGVFAWKNCDRSLMLCEEDHLHLADIVTGLSPRLAYAHLQPLLQELSSHLPFTDDDELGFITACPANVGAAVRTSLFCHLPGLVLTGKLEDFAASAAAAGFTVRGFWGEGSEVLGNTFQITDGPGLSHNVAEMHTRIETLGQEIAERECLARIELQSQRPETLKDKIARALAILQSCRVLSGGETLALFSAIRLGVDIGFIDGIPRNSISLLTFELGRAFISFHGYDGTIPDGRQVYRAQQARAAFANARFVG